MKARCISHHAFGKPDVLKDRRPIPTDFFQVVFAADPNLAVRFRRDGTGLELRFWKDGNLARRQTFRIEAVQSSGNRQCPYGTVASQCDVACDATGKSVALSPSPPLVLACGPHGHAIARRDPEPLLTVAQNPPNL